MPWRTWNVNNSTTTSSISTRIEQLDSAGSELSNKPKFVPIESVEVELFEKLHNPSFLLLIIKDLREVKLLKLKQTMMEDIQCYRILIFRSVNLKEMKNSYVCMKENIVTHEPSKSIVWCYSYIMTPTSDVTWPKSRRNVELRRPDSARWELQNELYYIKIESQEQKLALLVDIPSPHNRNIVRNNTTVPDANISESTSSRIVWKPPLWPLDLKLQNKPKFVQIWSLEIKLMEGVWKLLCHFMIIWNSEIINRNRKFLLYQKHSNFY